MSVLNPGLFRRLEKQFGEIRITNDGHANLFQYIPNYDHRGGRLQALVTQYGETYYVNCPFCGDDWKRLAINYHWAMREERTGDDMLHLVHCFNEECLKTRQAQKQLHVLLFPNGDWAYMCSPPSIVTNSPRLQTSQGTDSIKIPEGINVADLPFEHDARLYLRGRHLSSEVVGRHFGVRYCENNLLWSPKFYRPRLVYPVEAYELPTLPTWMDKPKKRLAGWQARVIGEPVDGEPKYLTAKGMRRNQMLYGLAQAKQGEQEILVIVEGVTDVWRLYPSVKSVALFGKTISTEQLRLLSLHFQGFPIVVFLDADAQAAAKRIRTQIMDTRAAEGDDAPVVMATVPKGRKDPGECSKQEASEAIANALR